MLGFYLQIINNYIYIYILYIETHSVIFADFGMHVYVAIIHALFMYMRIYIIYSIYIYIYLCMKTIFQHGTYAYTLYVLQYYADCVSRKHCKIDVMHIRQGYPCNCQACSSNKMSMSLLVTSHRLACP